MMLANVRWMTMGRIEDEIKSRIEFHYGSIPKFAKEIGMSPQTIYSVLRSGINGGSVGTVLPILTKLGIDSNWIIQNKLIDIENDGKEFSDVPIYGSIAAGTPIEMITAESTYPVPVEVMSRYPNSFLLKVEGNSMDRILPNGCYALIDPCDSIVCDSKPYAICVNGCNATIKRVKKLNNGFELVPDSTDPTFKPVLFDYGVEGTETITVIGKVVYYVLPYDWSF